MQSILRHSQIRGRWISIRKATAMKPRPPKDISQRIGNADGVGPVNCGLDASDGVFVSPTNVQESTRRLVLTNHKIIRRSDQTCSMVLGGVNLTGAD